MDYRDKVRQVFAAMKPDKELPGLGFVSGEELAKLKVPYPTKGDRWGNWQFGSEGLTLDYADGHEDHWYEVPLRHITSSAIMLDWICQVSGKAWISRKDVGDLVAAFEDLLEPQVTLCSCGQNKTLDTQKYLLEHLEAGG